MRARAACPPIGAVMLLVAVPLVASARVSPVLRDRGDVLVVSVGGLVSGDWSLREPVVGGGLAASIGLTYGTRLWNASWRGALTADLAHGVFDLALEGGVALWVFGLRGGLGWRTGALWIDPLAPRPGGPEGHAGIDVTIPLIDPETEDAEADRWLLRVFVQVGAAYHVDDGLWSGFVEGGAALQWEDR